MDANYLHKHYNSSNVKIKHFKNANPKTICLHLHSQFTLFITVKSRNLWFVQKNLKIQKKVNQLANQFCICML